MASGGTDEPHTMDHKRGSIDAQLLYYTYFKEYPILYDLSYEQLCELIKNKVPNVSDNLPDTWKKLCFMRTLYRKDPIFSVDGVEMVRQILIIRDFNQSICRIFITENNS